MNQVREFMNKIIQLHQALKTIQIIYKNPKLMLHKTIFNDNSQRNGLLNQPLQLHLHCEWSLTIIPCNISLMHKCYMFQSLQFYVNKPSVSRPRSEQFLRQEQVLHLKVYLNARTYIFYQDIEIVVFASSIDGRI